MRPSFGTLASLPKKRGDGAPAGATVRMCTPPFEGVAPSGAPSGVFLRRSGALCGGRPKWGTAAVSQLLAGSPYWPPGEAPTPPECVACSPRPQAPVRSTRAGATGSRPSWERTTIGILSYRNIVKRRIVGKDGARSKEQCAVSTEKIQSICEAHC